MILTVIEEPILECFVPRTALGIYSNPAPGLQPYSLASRQTKSCPPITTATGEPTLRYSVTEYGICKEAVADFWVFPLDCQPTFRSRRISTVTVKPKSLFSDPRTEHGIFTI